MGFCLTTAWQWSSAVASVVTQNETFKGTSTKGLRLGMPGGLRCIRVAETAFQEQDPPKRCSSWEEGFSTIVALVHSWPVFRPSILVDHQMPYAWRKNLKSL